MHCTAPPILNNSDFLRVISTDPSPHFNYNLRVDLLLLLLLLHFWICAFSLWQLEQSILKSIEHDEASAGAWRFPERTAVIKLNDSSTPWTGIRGSLEISETNCSGNGFEAASRFPKRIARERTWTTERSSPSVRLSVEVLKPRSTPRQTNNAINIVDIRFQHVTRILPYFFKFLLLSLKSSQIWLIPLVDDHHCCYITKLIF
jgi:hypothetical protein